MKQIKMSIISPVYGCAGCLEQLCERVMKAVESLGITYEIVFVDDRGPDGSWMALKGLAGRYPDRVRAIRLSRNFGQQAAITAGLNECRGEVAVVMDCDLQDPPEEIPNFYRKYQEGYQVVYSRRRGKRHSWKQRAGSRIYAKLVSLVFGRKVSSDVGGFSLIGRPVIDEFIRFKDINRHYLLILQWMGFDHAFIEYEHQERATGKSGYNIGKLIEHAIEGVMFQDARFFKWIVFLGMIIEGFGCLLAGWLVVHWLRTLPVAGWAMACMVACVVGGFVVMVQGVIGMYVGQTFEQVKGRPTYVVSDRLPDDKL